MVFPEDAHAAPALLPVLLLVLYDVLAPQVLHAPPLPRDGGVDDGEGLGVPQVEVLPVPGHWEKARASWKREKISKMLICHHCGGTGTDSTVPTNTVQVPITTGTVTDSG